MPHFLRAGRRNFLPEKLSAFQLFGRNYDFGFIFAVKTGFMPHLQAESAPKFCTGSLD